MDANLFIRSLASRGRLGGLTRGLAGILAVFRLLRCQYALIETVGVGQSELDVSDVVDYVALVLAPGHGDSVQLLTSGVMKIADCLIVNQADRAEAANLFAAVEHYLQWTAAPTNAVQRVAILVSATAYTGIDELLNYLDRAAEESRAQWTTKRDEVAQ